MYQLFCVSALLRISSSVYRLRISASALYSICTAYIPAPLRISSSTYQLFCVSAPLRINSSAYQRLCVSALPHTVYIPPPPLCTVCVLCAYQLLCISASPHTVYVSAPLRFYVLAIPHIRIQIPITMATSLRKCLRCNLQKNIMRFLPRHRICLDCCPQQPVLPQQIPPPDENFPLNTEHICSSCRLLRPIHLFRGVNDRRVQTCSLCRVSTVFKLYI